MSQPDMVLVTYHLSSWHEMSWQSLQILDDCHSSCHNDLAVLVLSWVSKNLLHISCVEATSIILQWGLACENIDVNFVVWCVKFKVRRLC